MPNSSTHLKLLSTPKEFDRKTRLSALSGPSRFLLMRLLMWMGGQQKELVRSALVERLLVSERVIRDGLRDLVAGQLLVEVARRRSEKGGVLITYRISPRFLESLSEVEMLPGVGLFEGAIEHFLTGAFPPESRGKGGRRTQLTPQNRLLLAALYARADVRGVVADASVAELKRIAGLSDDQFVSQMSKLGGRGFVRRHVPGVSASQLFGRARGWIYLNVAHPAFNEMRQPHWIVIGKERDGADPPLDVWELFRQTSEFFRSPRLTESFPDEWPSQTPVETRLRTGHRLPTDWLSRIAQYHFDWGFNRFGPIWGEQGPPSGPALYRYLVDRRLEVAQLIHAHVCDRAAGLAGAVMSVAKPEDPWRRLEQTMMARNAKEKRYWETVLRVGQGAVPGPTVVSAMMTLVEHLAKRVIGFLQEAQAVGAVPLERKVQLAIIPCLVPAGATPNERLMARHCLTVLVFPEYGPREDAGRCFVVDRNQRGPEGRAAAVESYPSEWKLERLERQKVGLEPLPKQYPSGGAAERAGDKPA